jgi:hypothetical protein
MRKPRYIKWRNARETFGDEVVHGGKVIDVAHCVIILLPLSLLKCLYTVVSSCSEKPAIVFNLQT